MFNYSKLKKGSMRKYHRIIRRLDIRGIILGIEGEHFIFIFFWRFVWTGSTLFFVGIWNRWRQFNWGQWYRTWGSDVAWRRSRRRHQGHTRWHIWTLCTANRERAWEARQLYSNIVTQHYKMCNLYRYHGKNKFLHHENQIIIVYYIWETIFPCSQCCRTTETRDNSTPCLFYHI